jgi:hypothetical protein
MTTLLDRYLFPIRGYLPKDAPQDDIIAEISDELQSQIEEGKDEAQVIKSYGHPRIVAARYGRAQYLIGPELFPFYLTTLRNVLVGGIALVLFGGGIAAILMHNGGVFFESLGIAWNTAWWIVAVVTILFVVVERLPQGRVNELTSKWDPLELPAPSTLPPASRFSALAEFIANFIAVLVLLDAWGPHHIPVVAQIASFLAQFHASFTGAWFPAYIATLAGSALIAGSAIAVFVRPNLSWLHEFFRAFASAVAAIGIAITLANGPWISAPDPGWNTAAMGCLISAIVVLVIGIVTSLRALRHLRAVTNAVTRPSL